MKPEHYPHPDAVGLICPLCSSSGILTNWEDHQFDFRVGKETVTLKAHLPIRRCKDCSFEFLDSEAEDAKEVVIRSYLRWLRNSALALRTCLV